MTYMTRYQVNATVTATGGASQAFYAGPFHGGYLEAFRIKRGTTATTASGLSTAAHVTLTGEQSGLTLFTATATGDPSQTYFPRAYACDTSAALIGFSTGATPPPGFPVQFPVAQERIKIEVTSGGAASNGGIRAVFTVWVSGAGV